MSLTKATYSMIRGAPGNVLDFGADNTGVADSATAFNAALAVHDNVYVPQGTYKILSTVTIQQGQILTGAGVDGVCTINATVDAGDAVFVLGTSTTALNYYPQIANFDILLNTDDSTGVRLFGTANARVSNIRVMGDVGDVAITKTAFEVDGVNSAFFNQFDNCYGFKCNIGFDHIDTGVSYSTQQVYINCSAIGGGTASPQVGFNFINNQGVDSLIIGGNSEGLDTGFRIETGGITIYGHRFEANTTDLQGIATTENTSVIGCRNVNIVVGLPGAQDGYGNNTFVGNNGTFGKDTHLESVTNIYAPDANKIPLNVQAYATQTANLTQYLNNIGTFMGGIGPESQVIVGGAAFGSANKLVLGGTTGTTVGAAGGASALPATPTGYLIAYVGTTPVRIPYYAAP
jgi:hypothetical protein